MNQIEWSHLFTICVTGISYLKCLSQQYHRSNNRKATDPIKTGTGIKQDDRISYLLYNKSNEEKWVQESKTYFPTGYKTWRRRWSKRKKKRSSQKNGEKDGEDKRNRKEEEEDEGEIKKKKKMK